MTAANKPVVLAAQARTTSSVVTAGAVLAALLLAGAGVALVHQGLVDGGLLGGRGWIEAAASWLDATTEVTAAAALIGLAVVGVVLLLLALTPGRRAELELPGEPGVVLQPGDLAGIASTTAETVDGVLTAVSVASTRRASITIEGTGDPRIVEAVRAAVGQRFQEIGLGVEVRAREATRRRGADDPVEQGRGVVTRGEADA